MKSISVEILLVEDDQGDIELAIESLQQSRLRLTVNVARDGVTAMTFMKNNSLPDVVLLDLNLPKKHGREVLREIKSDPDLKAIPVIVFTTSEAEEDIASSYELGCNCYIAKPVGFEKYLQIARSIEQFWFATVKLPPKNGSP